MERYSGRRIESSFELFRKRGPEIEDSGSWLCAGTADGYADLDGRRRSPGSGYYLGSHLNGLCKARPQDESQC